ncbi:ImmA/IrrE family metallo-endopeptidase [Lactobacillus gasseri]|uniref:ImmA/IrrE family metallo-endopeptidase n=1 Tax=Lactobacillus gasseri TaxID=1596 RepID=UPI0022AC7685|nr:ImmA/IrrE family metallo-endopeptidase [Lactobacillus gasseri]MCZ3664976.1 ImmA/IrrE family metallo-endopeptidase [Lactobacillus gasseri]MCZ3668569.1 ImmA/IrrE family metallo-endopeptidase [Lactobacillus gasseri]MDT9589711.1 ImmA/IrrE family metallo-endopeptidase [Lactobacillus gasseri]MDT9610908.1 ImmA/IrrE family metallo-endopeptidase [Lactobacillus gasseri]
MSVLDSHLRMLLKKYHLKLKFMPMDRDGYLVHGVVFVRESLSDEQIEKVILHEIGHAKNDTSVVGDYKYIGSAHTCSEHGANNFMVHEKIKQYVALGNEPDEANYVNIAVGLGINNFDEVREELLKYVAK